MKQLATLDYVDVKKKIKESNIEDKQKVLDYLEFVVTSHYWITEAINSAENRFAQIQKHIKQQEAKINSINKNNYLV